MALLPIMKKKITTLLAYATLAFAVCAQPGCKSGGNQSAGNNQSGAEPPANSARQEPIEPALAMTAEELIESYRMEPADGAGKYKGKTLAVTGTVSRNGKDFQGNLYVDLKGENTVIEVHCTYDEDQHAAMSALRKGQQATIKGVCDGRFMSSVVLKHSVPQ